MGLNWRAAFSSALETGAGLMADSITRDRNLADKQSLLSLSDEMEQAKAARVRQEIASVTGGVSREVDDPTHPEGKRRLSDAEWNAAVADRFTQEGRVGEAKYYQDTADKLSDNARQTKKDEAEQTWRMERARIEDEFRQGQITHQQALDKMQAATNARLAKSAALQDQANQLKIDEAKEEAAGRQKVRGLIDASLNVDRSQPGAAESEAFYRKEAEKQEQAILLAQGKVMPGGDRATSAQRAAQWTKIAEGTDDPIAKQEALSNAAAELKRAHGETGAKAQDVRVGGVVIGQASSPEEAKAMVEKHLAANKKTGGKAAPAGNASQGIISAQSPPKARDWDAQIAEQQRIAATSYVDPEVRLAAKLKADELIGKRNAAMGLPTASEIPLSMR